MEIHHAVRDVVDRVGPGLLQDAESFRGVLDDVLDEEDAGVGDVNLLVDAVRFGAVDQLIRLLDSDADPTLAATTVGAGFARQRGGADTHSASWACAVLGFAVGRVSDDVVRDLAARCPPADVVATLPQPAADERPTGPGRRSPPVMTAVSPSPTLTITEGITESSRPRSRRRLVVLVGAALLASWDRASWLFLVLDGRTTPKPRARIPRMRAATRPARGPGRSAGTASRLRPWLNARHPPTSPGSRGSSRRRTTRSASPRVRDSPPRSCSGSARWRSRTAVTCRSTTRNGVTWLDGRSLRSRAAGRGLRGGAPDLVAFAVEAPDQLQKVVLFYLDEEAPFAVTVYADCRDRSVRRRRSPDDPGSRPAARARSPDRKSCPTPSWWSRPSRRAEPGTGRRNPRVWHR